MTDSTAAYFHEDDFCQIEILPVEAEGFIRRQMTESDAFAAAHEAQGGGWTDIYIRQGPAAKLASLKIPVTEIVECIPKELARFDRVMTGFGSSMWTSSSTLAWGIGRSALLFVTTNQENLEIVEHIWLSSFAAEEVPSVRSLLTRCALRWSLIYVDWWWSRIVRLGDGDELNAYLALRERAGDE